MGQVISRKSVADFVEKLHKAGKTVVVTNGCFDILHVGHVRYLQKSARNPTIFVWFFCMVLKLI